ncbi:MAG: hypothetical protein H0A75_06360 [Candidatus Methanofishera endochildressiae]|uniref:Type I restriction modification DNA specificity domain-containing protein n=1 Tax=Candidatus Methanofishera endochildressiae TaxID=2738884 RepID=A0A7Z0SFC8_9GAMM|nr:hypothetical protein [Candidatus Methanofishera endochildressiae]
MALNQDVALIYPKEELLSGFLAVYFNCSFGQGFADSLKTEQMNPYISLVNLAKLPVPLLDIIFQQRIEDIVLLSQQIKSQSERKYKDAQYLLLSELGLSNWKPKHQLSFVKNYSDTEQARRIDAEYYKPKYDVLLQIIDQNSEYTKKISEIKVYNARGLQPKYSSNGSLDVITSKRILENGLDFDNFDKTDLENWDLQKKARIKKGSILTYTTGS